MQNNGEVRQSAGYFFENIKTKCRRHINAVFVFRALFGFEFICTVTGSDGDSQGIDTRTADEFFNLFGTCVGSFVSSHLHIIFNTGQFTQFGFDDNAPFMSVVGNPFSQFYVFIEAVLRTVNHDRCEAAVNTILTSFKVRSVIKM